MLGLNKEKTLIVHLGCRSTWFIMNVLFCLKFLSSAFVWSHLKKKNNNNFEFVLLKKNKRNEQKTLEINTLSNNFPFCLFLITFKSSKLFNFPWKHTWVSFFPVFCFAALSLALILVSGSTLSRIKNNRISFMTCSFCSHANRICACVCACFRGVLSGHITFVPTHKHLLPFSFSSLSGALFVCYRTWFKSHTHAGRKNITHCWSGETLAPLCFLLFKLLNGHWNVDRFVFVWWFWIWLF